MTLYREALNVQVFERDSSVLRFNLNGVMPGPEYTSPIGDIPVGSALHEIYWQLMSPFADKDVELDADNMEVGELQRSEILGQVRNMVNYAYNSRYHHNGGEVVQLAGDRFDNLPTTRTIVAVQEIDGQPVVMGTFRTLAGSDLDVFELFEMRAGMSWPHQTDAKVLLPGELGRFCLSPVFEALAKVNIGISNVDLRNMKIAILQKMWRVGMDQMIRDGVEVPYFILKPEVRDFVRKAGIIPTTVEAMQPSQTEYAQRIRQLFSEYWRPDDASEEQPQVYIAPWNVSPA